MYESKNLFSPCFSKCVDEEDDADDNTSFNGGYGKSSMSPYDDDDIGKNHIKKFGKAIYNVAYKK